MSQTLITDMYKSNARADQKVLAVVPVFGDVSQLWTVLHMLRSLSLETLVINDGNGAGLSKALKQREYRVYDMGHNRGVGAATIQGLLIAATEGYKGIVSVDADGAHDQLSVAQVAATALSNPTQPVFTTRFGHLAERYIPRSKRAANAFAAELFYVTTGHRLSDVASGLRYYPVSLARLSWQQQRFGFIFEVLKHILDSGQKYSLIKTFVCYPKVGPHLTKANELNDLINFCLSVRMFNREDAAKLDSLRSPSTIKKAQSIQINLNDRSFQLDPVPSQRSFLISESFSRSEGLEKLRVPKTGTISFGLIPDGGRRWAVRNDQTLKTSYLRTYSLITKFLSMHRHELDVIGIYCYSLYNLKRPRSQMVALFEAVEEFTERMLPKSYTPIFFGDVLKLPENIRNYTLRVNRRSSETYTSGPLVVMCTIFSVSWQRTLLSPDGVPWKFMLSPVVLQRILAMRFALLFRTGNAQTFSDFFPDASGYAVVSFRKPLFNDIDLEAWWRSYVQRLEGVKYGT